MFLTLTTDVTSDIHPGFITITFSDIFSTLQMSCWIPYCGDQTFIILFEMTQNMVFSVSVSKVLACEQLSQILTFFLIDILHSVTIVLKSGYTEIGQNWVRIFC